MELQNGNECRVRIQSKWTDNGAFKNSYECLKFQGCMSSYSVIHPLINQNIEDESDRVLRQGLSIKEDQEISFVDFLLSIPRASEDEPSDIFERQRYAEGDYAGYLRSFGVLVRRVLVTKERALESGFQADDSD